MKILAFLTIGALCASCAPLPQKAIAAGEVEISVFARERIVEHDPLTGNPTTKSSIQALEGVACNMRNDKGSWSATSGGALGDPVRVSVQRSAQALEVECAKEGYHTIRASLKCTSLREVKATRPGGPGVEALLGGLQLLTLNPFGLFTLYDAYHASEASHAPGSPEYDLCTYWGVAPIMARATEPNPDLGVGWRLARP